MNTRKGFTLIELLVVISIIGVLSGVVLSALNNARAKARDAKRISDLHQIQTAIEFFYDDFGEYPPIGIGAVDEADDGCGGGWESSEIDINANGKFFIESLQGQNPLGKNYMAGDIPRDPRPFVPGGCSGYFYFKYGPTSPQCQYKLMTLMETKSTYSAALGCGGYQGGGANYIVTP